MRRFLIKAISLYQKTLSPDHGWLKSRHPYGYCKYYPTCSSYAIQAIDKYGSIKGVLLALARVARCNPFSRGGVDHIPH